MTEVVVIHDDGLDEADLPEVPEIIVGDEQTLVVFPDGATSWHHHN